MADTTYDVAIIGSGPGGYVAAIRAAQLGMKAAVIERGAMGGVCLNIGCIPSKALLHTAEVLDEAREGKRIGFVADNIRLDWSGLMGHKERVVKQMTGGVESLMKKNKVDVIRGTATLLTPTSIDVKGEGTSQTVNARNLIIATGGYPRSLPFAQIDEQTIMSSTGMLSLPEPPKRLVVIGGGVIGIEMASAYRSFGSEVTVLDALPRIVSLEDEEISAELEKALARRGMKIMTSVRISAVEAGSDGTTVHLTDKDGKEHKLVGDRVLMAVGRGPNTKNIGLETLAIPTDERGYILVNGMLQTNIPNVYAIGDCIPTPWLAHVASAEGILAVEHMAGQHVEPINYDKIPACTYCSPEVSSIGLTEAKAKERGFEVKIGKFPFSANGKATILASRTGFVKIVADAQYGEILGVHMIGPRVTELIAEGGMALSHEATSESMVHTIHAHPTLYEAMLEAAHGLIDGPIHI
ncbi:MAG: dihydrolipoyl dehydrogenase [Herpetosiphonaceae bacterium]|nr:dihydrolipoyl dehydrogenase [Herpetosiphonaceae bacterium]